MILMTLVGIRITITKRVKYAFQIIWIYREILSGSSDFNKHRIIVETLS